MEGSQDMIGRRVAQWISALVFGSGEHRFKPHCSQHVVVSLRHFTPKCSCGDWPQYWVCKLWIKASNKWHVMIQKAFEYWITNQCGLLVIHSLAAKCFLAMLFFVLHISKCIKCVFTSVPSCLLQYGSSGQDGSPDGVRWPGTGCGAAYSQRGELNVETVFLWGILHVVWEAFWGNKVKLFRIIQGTMFRQ